MGRGSESEVRGPRSFSLRRDVEWLVTNHEFRPAASYIRRGPGIGENDPPTQRLHQHPPSVRVHGYPRQHENELANRKLISTRLISEIRAGILYANESKPDGYSMTPSRVGSSLPSARAIRCGPE